MKAISLMAGASTRLSPLTAMVHKCLLDLAGRPLLTWHLDTLDRGGIDEVVLVVGHGADQIERQLTAYPPQIPVTLVRNPYYSTLNMDYSFFCAYSEVAGEDALYVEGDLFVHPRLISKIIEHPLANCIAVDPTLRSTNVDTLVLGTALRAEHLLFSEHGDLSSSPASGCIGEFVCIGKFSRWAMSFVYEELSKGDFRGPMQLYKLFDALFAQWETGFVSADGDPWIEIDTFEDLYRTRSVMPLLSAPGSTQVDPVS